MSVLYDVFSISNYICDIMDNFKVPKYQRCTKSKSFGRTKIKLPDDKKFNIGPAIGSSKRRCAVENIYSNRLLRCFSNLERNWSLIMLWKRTPQKDTFVAWMVHRYMDVWFEVWLNFHVPKVMHQPEWFINKEDLKIGDLFVLCNTYLYGKSVEKSQDWRIRKALVAYWNNTEDVTRVTYCAVRSLVMIHPVDKLSISEELAMNGNELI